MNIINSKRLATYPRDTQNYDWRYISGRSTFPDLWILQQCSPDHQGSLAERVSKNGMMSCSRQTTSRDLWRGQSTPFVTQTDYVLPHSAPRRVYWWDQTISPGSDSERPSMIWSRRKKCCLQVQRFHISNIRNIVRICIQRCKKIGWVFSPTHQQSTLLHIAPLNTICAI